MTNKTIKTTRPQPMTDDEIAAALQAERWIYLAIGPNVWGRGYSRDQALAAMRSNYHGHTPARGIKYILIACTDPWSQIGPMGDIEYTPRPFDGPRNERPKEYITVEDRSDRSK